MTTQLFETTALFQDLRIEAELVAEDYFPGPETLYFSSVNGTEFLGGYSAVYDAVGPIAQIFEFEVVDDLEGIYEAVETCRACPYDKIIVTFNAFTDLHTFEALEPDCDNPWGYC